MGKPLLNTSSDSNVQWERTLTMNEGEESEDAFDSLIEKICEPAPWDYDPKEVPNNA